MTSETAMLSAFKRMLPFGLLLVVCGGCSTAVPDRGDAQPVKLMLKVVQADSEETNGENGYAANVVDDNPSTIWHTQWHDKSPALPHEIIIELVPPCTIKGFSYLPRQDASDHGDIKDYEFYVSNDRTNFGRPVNQGVFGRGKDEKIEKFPPVKCRFIKLKALSEINGLPWTSVAEIRVFQPGEAVSPKKYRPVSPKSVPAEIVSSGQPATG